MSQKNRDNVVEAVEQGLELGNAPYIHAPYPEYIARVHEGETRGERDVMELINSEWPATIDELEETSREMFDDGYSGSFIRSVLRHNYAPQDMIETSEPAVESEIEGEVPDSPGGRAEPDMTPAEEAWHKVFRVGIRIALENNISEDDAFDAFGSGFVEGRKLKEEMER